MANFSNIIQNVSRALILDYDLERFLRLIMDALIEETNAEHGMIVVLDEKGNHQCKAARDRQLRDIADPAARRSKTIIDETLRTGEYQFYPDALSDPNLRSKSTGSIMSLNLVSLACAPLRDNERVFGVIYLDSDKAPALFNQKTGALLAQIAIVIAGVIKDLQQRRPQQEVHAPQTLKFQGAREPVEVVIANSRMELAYHRAQTIAYDDMPVLILGEPGTGKDLLAQFIHARSGRSGKYLAVDCGTLMNETFVSELFGHIKGAFTGAIQNRAGLVATARNGTLFLDEIGELSLDSQARLLRFLQSGEYKPLGSDEFKRAENVRIIAATNRRLQQMVEDGKFRQDLFDRLNDYPLELPPLRERPEEILPLARHYLEAFCKKYDKPNLELSLPAALYLKQHRLRGNVRELIQKIRRAVMSCTEKLIRIEDFDLIGSPGPRGGGDDEKNFKAAKNKIVATFEREFITARLQETGGKVKAAAKASGMPTPNFSNKMRKYGINPKKFYPQ